MLLLAACGQSPATVGPPAPETLKKTSDTVQVSEVSAPVKDSLPPAATTAPPTPVKKSVGAKGKTVHAPLPDHPPTSAEDSARREKQRQKRAKEGRQ